MPWIMAYPFCTICDNWIAKTCVHAWLLLYYIQPTCAFDHMHSYHHAVNNTA